ncbi:MAG: NUDIX hydrolase [Gammaproteobacteria bacterium]
MKFCSACGNPVEHRVPEGDSLPRHVCPACGTIHYSNPRMVVGCVPEYGSRILLCRRAIEPRYGFWTVPAGFMENDETLAQAAARETLEEALARVEIRDLFAIVDVVHARQVHVMFRATLPEAEFGAGAESLEVELFEPDEIPWKDIAFPSVAFALERFLEDRAAGLERLHTTALNRPMKDPGRRRGS